MGNLWIKVNYADLQVAMSKVVSAHMELQGLLDDAAGSESTEPAVCDNNDCPHRRQDKGE
jgi:hypothetical protein